MKTRMMAGGEFEKNERQLIVCFLNQAAAGFFFPHEQAVGRYVRNRVTPEFPDQVACQGVGLAEDAKFYDVRQGPPRPIYMPLSRERIDNLGNLVVLIHSPTKTPAVPPFRTPLSAYPPTFPP